jgi:hypothetical protein
MKKKMNIPKSVKIYIRREKANIRRGNSGREEQYKLVQELYERLGFLVKAKDENK